MKLGMTSWHTVDTAPVQTYNGNELVPQSTYERLMTGGYMSSFMFAKVGAKALRLSLDVDTEERWRRLTCASYYIDEFVDGADTIPDACNMYEQGLAIAINGDDPDEIIQQLPERASPLLVPSVLSLRNSVTDVSDDQRQQLNQTATDINTIARQKLQTKDIYEYIDLIMCEAATTADLIDQTATDAVKQQDTYRQFSAMVHDGIAIAVSFDSAIDMRDDYNEGVMQVQPKLRHMARLAIGAIAPARRMTKWDSGSLRATCRMAAGVRPRLSL